MSSKYIPRPLFDTLENLNQDLDTKNLQSQLSNTMSIQHILNDYKYSIQFLHSYRGSAETFKSYRREIERLLQWSWFLQAKTLKELRRSDLEAFLEFCQSPPKEWIGTKHVSRFIDKEGLRVAN